MTSKLSRNKNSRRLHRKRRQQRPSKSPSRPADKAQDEARLTDWRRIHGLLQSYIVGTNINRVHWMDLGVNSLLGTLGLMHGISRSLIDKSPHPTQSDPMAVRRSHLFRLVVQAQDGEAVWGRQLPMVVALGGLGPLGITLLPLTLSLLTLDGDH